MLLCGLNMVQGSRGKHHTQGFGMKHEMAVHLKVVLNFKDKGVLQITLPVLLL